MSTSTSAPAPTPTISASKSKLRSGVVAGSVVGSLSGISVIAIAVFIILRHRQRKFKSSSEGQAQHEKAQLHSDDYHPPRMELEAEIPEDKTPRTVWKPSMIELPVHEIAASEVDGSSLMSPPRSHGS
ncbi:MAG: hypothetical protein Q9227_008380 [Pyrenula ochraceoflavens]